MGLRSSCTRQGIRPPARAAQSASAARTSGRTASPPATTVRSALDGADVSLLAPEPVDEPPLLPAVRVLACDEDVSVAVPFRRFALRWTNNEDVNHISQYT